LTEPPHNAGAKSDGSAHPIQTFIQKVAVISAIPALIFIYLAWAHDTEFFPYEPVTTIDLKR
jgi:hypothetical protein